MFLMEEFRHLKIQLQDIILATDNFGPNKLIGRGGFGPVYKGELEVPEGRSMVAFKRLDPKFGQGNTEFWKEIMMLSKCKHENLVSLINFCFEGEERILVYEYASRGSLDRHLSDSSLTWIQRLNICIGVARALNYLHDPMDTKQRVLHRDIKSSNILLDEQWNAKVSDFGLSKVGPANQTQTYLVSNPVGTFGYFDPSYFETGVLSKESDVYSFGVVLFEVMCGRLCCEYRNGELIEILVPLWKKCFDEERVDDIIFHDLKGKVNHDSLMTFSTIANQCLNRDHKERPTMVEIVQALEVALILQANGGSYGMTSAIVIPSALELRLQLRFEANLPKTFFTGSCIESKDMTAVKLVLFDVKSNKVVSSGPLSSLKIEIVALDGDFRAAEDGYWSDEHFDAKIIHSRRPLIKGNLVVTLKNGVADLGGMRFAHYQSWGRMIKFVIGARAMGTAGVRIREAVSPAFILKDRRTLSYKKQDPPSLVDEIWRLDRISKRGDICKRLASHNICTVMDFMQMYVTNQFSLRLLLGGLSDETWKTIVKHAKASVLDDNLYMYRCATNEGITLLLDPVLKVVGATFDGKNYLPVDKLSVLQMRVVEASKQEVYENLDGIVPIDDISIFGAPVPMSNLHHDPRQSASLILQDVNNIPNLHQELQNWSPDLQNLYRRLHSNQEWMRNGVTVEVEAGVFGPIQTPLVIQYDDLELLMTRGWIDQNIITWFMALLYSIISKRLDNRCGFVCPGAIQANEIDRDGPGVIESLCNTMIHNKDLSFFLAPYARGYHWLLLLVWPQSRTIYILDSLMPDTKAADIYVVKNYIETAITMYNNDTGSCQTDISAPVTWHEVKCNQQEADWECGYYVLKFMYHFVLEYQFDFSDTNPWTTTSPFTLQELDQLASMWARNFISKHLTL